MISSAEMCRLAGCTYRQLDYWCRTRVVVPIAEARGSGSARRFTERQVRLVRLVADLYRLGARGDAALRASMHADLIPLDAWIGTAYVDPDGNLSLDAPRGPAWAIDLGRCADPSALPARQLALV